MNIRHLLTYTPTLLGEKIILVLPEDLVAIAPVVVQADSAAMV